jgi:hypothetical protein
MSKDFFHSNPFQKGYISDEDRKKQLKYTSGNYEFYSETIDLYNGLDLTFIKDDYHEAPKISEYSHALADFMMWWERDIRSHLNGFCGFDCIKFRFFGFGYIRLD